MAVPSLGANRSPGRHSLHRSIDTNGLPWHALSSLGLGTKPAITSAIRFTKVRAGFTPCEQAVQDGTFFRERTPFTRHKQAVGNSTHFASCEQAVGNGTLLPSKPSGTAHFSLGTSKPSGTHALSALRAVRTGLRGGTPFSPPSRRSGTARSSPHAQALCPAVAGFSLMERPLDGLSSFFFCWLGMVRPTALQPWPYVLSPGGRKTWHSRSMKPLACGLQ